MHAPGPLDDRLDDHRSELVRASLGRYDAVEYERQVANGA